MVMSSNEDAKTEVLSHLNTLLMYCNINKIAIYIISKCTRNPDIDCVWFKIRHISFRMLQNTCAL